MTNPLLPHTKSPQAKKEPGQPTEFFITLSIRLLLFEVEVFATWIEAVVILPAGSTLER